MIRKELVFINDKSISEDECLQFLINEIDKCQLLKNKEEYLESVHKREQDFSTAVGFKVAIPHGMSDSVNESFIAFMKSEESIYWGKEKKEVQLIFLIGVPEHKKILHI